MEALRLPKLPNPTYFAHISWEDREREGRKGEGQTLFPLFFYPSESKDEQVYFSL